MDGHSDVHDTARDDVNGNNNNNRKSIDWAEWTAAGQAVLDGARPLDDGPMGAALLAMAHGVGFFRDGARFDTAAAHRMLGLCVRFWRAAERVAGDHVPRALDALHMEEEVVPTPWAVISWARHLWCASRLDCHDAIITKGTSVHLDRTKNTRDSTSVDYAEQCLFNAALAIVSDPIAARRRTNSCPGVVLPGAPVGLEETASPSLLPPVESAAAASTAECDPSGGRRRYDIVLSSPTGAGYVGCTLFIDDQPWYSMFDRAMPLSDAKVVIYRPGVTDPVIADAVAASANELHRGLTAHECQCQLLQTVVESAFGADASWPGDIYIEGLRWHRHAGAGLSQAIIDRLADPIDLQAPGWLFSPPFASVTLTADGIHNVIRRLRLHDMATKALERAPSLYTRGSDSTLSARESPLDADTLVKQCARAYRGSLVGARNTLPGDVLGVVATHAAWRLCRDIARFRVCPVHYDYLAACLSDDDDAEAQLAVMAGALGIARTHATPTVSI
ncbi:hypothetical protein TW95_gp1362 [Pandoravirus inopinatum]|uniref:DUF5848 domain-containing protein n=1 Tax=Pandoravirus inopinatum TaxID=1605721 RepID=A0A0B5JAT1_9VIRU|nr:hypothetical protein TW95_gp1362 [Pandoravirus inopinatum]AJF98096.1 hypothetical protein [Pandoravirus inopinatum]